MSEQPLLRHATLFEAVRAIEGSRRRIAVVIDENRQLLGTLTDGDVRRCLLAGGSLETPIHEAMNAHPATAESNAPDGHILQLMRERNVLAVPIVERGRFVRMCHLTDLQPDHDTGSAQGFSFAVIMAGGEGKRLRPVTENLPKPMVDIGGEPLLARQIGRLASAGMSEVYISVNYLGHIIEEHFGDGASAGVRVNYLREKQRLGTGGALSLLPQRPSGPIIVMNGDILTTVDFGGLHAFHQAQNAVVTMAAVDYRVNIPFGVIEADGPRVQAIKEKPAQRFLCNAGMYAVSPDALDLIPSDRYYDMTDLVNDCLAAGHRVAVFPIHEYWSDIGTPDDLDKARALFDSQVIR